MMPAMFTCGRTAGLVRPHPRAEAARQARPPGGPSTSARNRAPRSPSRAGTRSRTPDRGRPGTSGRVQPYAFRRPGNTLSVHTAASGYWPECVRAPWFRRRGGGRQHVGDGGELVARPAGRRPAAISAASMARQPAASTTSGRRLATNPASAAGRWRDRPAGRRCSRRPTRAPSASRTTCWCR